MYIFEVDSIVSPLPPTKKPPETHQQHIKPSPDPANSLYKPLFRKKVKPPKSTSLLDNVNASYLPPTNNRKSSKPSRKPANKSLVKPYRSNS